jgi:hypothetical protein
MADDPAAPVDLELHVSHSKHRGSSLTVPHAPHRRAHIPIIADDRERVSVLQALLLLETSLVVGALIVGKIESWTVVDSWYFAVTTVTTGAAVRCDCARQTVVDRACCASLCSGLRRPRAHARLVSCHHHGVRALLRRLRRVRLRTLPDAGEWAESVLVAASERALHAGFAAASRRFSPTSRK